LRFAIEAAAPGRGSLIDNDKEQNKTGTFIARGRRLGKSGLLVVVAVNSFTLHLRLSM